MGQVAEICNHISIVKLRELYLPSVGRPTAPLQGVEQLKSNTVANKTKNSAPLQRGGGRRPEGSSFKKDKKQIAPQLASREELNNNK